MSTVRPSIAIFLSTLLAAGSLTQAQDLTAASASEAPQQIRLQIADQPSPNKKNGPAGADPIVVTVTDTQGHPVPNATVLFRLPAEKPRGLFEDGSRVQVLSTDMAGQAAIKGIRWDSNTGTAVIRVTATKGIAHAGLLLEQKLGSEQPKEAAAALPTPSASAAVTKAAKAAKPQGANASAIPVTTAGAPNTPGTPAEPAQLAHTTLPDPDDSAAPHVTISSRPTTQVTGAEGHSRKWIWVGLAGAAAAGMAFAFAGHGGGSAAAPANPNSGLTIGNPTVSIGH